ncbi:hypothetical protein G4B88_017007 [Cannabis sativa]|uniref:DUF4283 domain-containing protein n=1 Tax=Cannabis sativa TaxID=3483 RepID=A0A7J6E705_CANSA|nr:hypothetical protein G4B88_017007 [Cannabis sativa]
MASSSRNDGDLSKKWADMCLDEEEDTEAIFDEEDGDETEPDLDDRWCLIGRLLTSKVSDFLVFQNIMADLWKPGKGMYVKILEQNRLLFQFYHEIDIRRVINGSPWTYDRKQLITERLKPGGNPKNVMLNTLDMWVQIHDLQSGFRTEKAESGVKFSSDLEFEISEGKRKRMDSLFNGPINNNSGPVESKWVGRPSTDRCLKLGNSRYWQVGSCWELEILPFFIVYLREVLINHTITDELKLGRLPLNKKTPRQL